MANQNLCSSPMNTLPDAPQSIAPDVKLGKGVRLYGFVNLYGCAIGDDTKIGTFVEIQKHAKIGRCCKISSHTFICEGVTIEDEVFVGHGVTFVNDLYPRAVTAEGSLQTDADWVCVKTWVRRGAAIGSGATILCGITIGQHAIIGAGSVVTRNVPAHAVVAGNPARVLRYTSEKPASRPAPQKTVGRKAAVDKLAGGRGVFSKDSPARRKS